MAKISMPPKKYAIPLAIALAVALAIYAGLPSIGLAENLVLIAFAGFIALAVWFDRWVVKRLTPADKFSLLHPWKIPDPASRREIWRIAAFDGAVNTGQAAIIFALMGRMNLQTGLSGWLMAALVPAIMALTAAVSYWRYRRRYDIIADTGGRLLRYAGERPLTFREKCQVAAAIVGWIIAWHAILFVVLFWFL